MSGKKLKKMLEKNGWICDRIKGSHHIMIKDNDTIPIPIHSNKDLKKGTLNGILKQAGLK
ncbi:MAG: type II toxin-antitoxin system HicA family toxin [Bacteroidetes bacterium]|nr:type II toxin-antitoxin system HicA family toxin [Bacteroidota bacterium]